MLDQTSPSGSRNASIAINVSIQIPSIGYQWHLVTLLVLQAGYPSHLDLHNQQWQNLHSLDHNHSTIDEDRPNLAQHFRVHLLWIEFGFLLRKPHLCIWIKPRFPFEICIGSCHNSKNGGFSRTIMSNDSDLHLKRQPNWKVLCHHHSLLVNPSFER